MSEYFYGLFGFIVFTMLVIFAGCSELAWCQADMFWFAVICQIKQGHLPVLVDSKAHVYIISFNETVLCKMSKKLLN